MDVIFEPQRGGGRSFSIEVGFFDTVLEIKEKIQKYQGIPVHKQTLVFNGHVLLDDRDVEYCEILQNSRIQLYIAAADADKTGQPQVVVKAEESSPPPPPRKIQVQLNVRIPSSSKMHFSLEMDANDSVSRLKERVYQELDHPTFPISRLALFLQSSGGGELQDHRYLRDCEVVDNSEILVTVRPPPAAGSGGAGSGGPTGAAAAGSKKLKVMVLTKCGTRKIPVEVNPSDNVGELRKELQKLHQKLNFDLPQEGYFFICKQNVMDDDRSFRWHHVNQGDTIEIFNGSVTGGS